MATKILCVDDEPNVLEALERLLSDSFDVTITSDPHEALEILAKEPFAVVMSDMRMPHMSGADLLTRARNAAPQTVRILLTGQADLATAAAAVNEGAVFRFLVKPCPADALSAALGAALEQHRLLTAERELLDRTLTSMVKLLTDVLAVGSPGIFKRTGRIQRYVVHMAKALSLPNAWQYEVAASLSQLGCMALPDELITKVVSGARLTTADRASYDTHPEIAHRLLLGIPRLADVARIVLAQRPRETTTDPIAVTGARLLRIATSFDALIETGQGIEQAVASLTTSSSHEDRPFVATLVGVSSLSAGVASRLVKLQELQTGMVFEEDVRAHNGNLLMKAGTDVSVVVLERLNRFASGVGVVQPIRVKNAA
jgi:response regulator RpfG family c-di-GMP phosphodiesterase